MTTPSSGPGESGRSRSRDFSFARRPKWIAGHLLAILGIVVFVNMAFWQLRRLDERRTFNALVDSRANPPAEELPPAAAARADPEELDWLLVEVTGTYIPEDEVILQARSLDGISGHNVLTPLLVDGQAVIVDRGWVPIDAKDPPVAGAEPAGGTVTVTGVLRKTEVRGTFGPTDPATGTLTRISRVDVARLQQQTDVTLYPMWIQLTGQDPEVTAPIPQPLPTLSEGPHLGYAVQWFLFTAVVIVGYPILLWRTAEGEEPEAPPRAG
jgi:surfeit locus 1 family protein